MSKCYLSVMQCLANYHPTANNLSCSLLRSGKVSTWCSFFLFVCAIRQRIGLFCPHFTYFVFQSACLSMFHPPSALWWVGQRLEMNTDLLSIMEVGLNNSFCDYWGLFRNKIRMTFLKTSHKGRNSDRALHFNVVFQDLRLTNYTKVL